MLKRYLVFVHACYYANGWEDDFQGSFDSLEECEEAILPFRSVLGHSGYWYEIIDQTDLTVLGHNNYKQLL